MITRHQAHRFAASLCQALKATLHRTQVSLDPKLSHGGYPALIVSNGAGRTITITLFSERGCAMCPSLLAAHVREALAQ